MYSIFGFYKFKKLTTLKSKKKYLDSLFTKNDIRGTIIISNEGLNGTISFKTNRLDNIIKSLKKIFNINKFNNENLTKCKFQPFHKGKIKIKKEVVPLGIKIKKKISDNELTPHEWNKFINRKDSILIDTRKNFEFKVGTFNGSVNPKLKGAPTDHKLEVREIRLSSGAEFIVVICGTIMTMPGLPRTPAADKIKLNKKGDVEGLF